MPHADPEAWVFHDGEFKRYRDVHLGLFTHALLFGTGCFDSVRGYWNDEREQLFLLQPADHYERLADSCGVLFLDLPHTTAELIDLTAELVRRNEIRQTCYVRSLVFKSAEGFAIPYREMPTSVALVSVPMGMYLDTDKGVRCKVSSWRRISDDAVPPRAKITGTYVNAYLARLEAEDAGYDEAILLDSSGHVSEGPGENLFMKRGDQWVTPPVTADILEGVTRKTLLRLIRDDLGLRAVERTIDRSELYACDELFLCGTGAEITPVIDVDGRPVGSGKVGDSTAKLQELFFAMTRGDLDRYKDWLVPVY